MKKLKKLNLSSLAESNLLSDEMNALKGGSGCCYCSCYYEGNGGSSSEANMGANWDTGSSSNKGCNQYVACGCGSGPLSNCDESNSGSGTLG